MQEVYQADNLEWLKKQPSNWVDLIYIDPPFNTGKQWNYTPVTENHSVTGETTIGYADSFSDYMGFLRPRLEEAHRLLKMTGSLYFHIDYREVHYCKILLDSIFGRANFINEIIWAYDYGARQKNKWPTKHDNILFYAKDSTQYFFDTEEVDRIPYMAPGLVGPDKADRGKLPTDTWWHTIVPTNGSERVGYPTQKPIGILKRIVAASSPKDGIVLDFFAGSGTTGAAAKLLGRNYIMVDENPVAIQKMKERGL